MPSVDRKWLPPVLIAVSLIASIAAFNRLPASLELQFDVMRPFMATPLVGQASRVPVLFLMPILAFAMWLSFRFAPTPAGQRIARRIFWYVPEDVTSPGQFERFGKTYDVIVLGVVVLILGFHVAVMAAAFQVDPAIVSRIVPAILGAAMVLMGNVMPRLRPNWVAGIRTRRTLENPQLWRSTHRVFGTAFVVSGLVTIIAAMLIPQWGLLVAILSILASCVVGGVASMGGKAVSI